MSIRYFFKDYKQSTEIIHNKYMCRELPFKFIYYVDWVL